MPIAPSKSTRVLKPNIGNNTLRFADAEYKLQLFTIIVPKTILAMLSTDSLDDSKFTKVLTISPWLFTSRQNKHPTNCKADIVINNEITILVTLSNLDLANL